MTIKLSNPLILQKIICRYYFRVEILECEIVKCFTSNIQVNILLQIRNLQIDNLHNVIFPYILLLKRFLESLTIGMEYFSKTPYVNQFLDIYIILDIYNSLQLIQNLT